MDERLFLATARGNHDHNWEANPKVTVNVGSGTEVVIVEGTGRYEREPEVLQRFLDAYNPKYGYDFGTDSMSYAVEVVAEVVPRLAGHRRAGRERLRGGREVDKEITWER